MYRSMDHNNQIRPVARPVEKFFRLTEQGFHPTGWLSVWMILSLSLPVSASEFLEPEMIAVPAGPFQCGTTQKERDRYLIPHHQPGAQIIELPTYWIGKYEVTNGEYACFIADGGYRDPAYWSGEGWDFRERRQWTQPRRWHDKNYNEPGMERYPVCAVSGYEAHAYCRWLSAKTGKPYRLPTSKEWEKAARGTDGRIFPWGDEWRPDACNWLGGNGNSVRGLAPVGSYENGQSQYGCFDMAGNVQEWCGDDWIDPRRPEIKTGYKNFRGGHFRSSFPRWMRCAWSGGDSPELGQVLWPVNGFRIAMDDTGSDIIPH